MPTEIVLCELFNPAIHGLTEDSSGDIQTHYIVTEKIDPSEVLGDATATGSTDSDNPFVYARLRKNMLTHTIRQSEKIRDHEYIRNYVGISTKSDTYLPQLATCVQLPGDECVAILKTHWLRLIQRSWRNVLRNRSNVTKLRCHPDNMRMKEIKGRWSKECQLPSMRGMLSGLSRG